jgi:hypothetical protein
MTPNERIARSALLAAQGKLPAVALAPGWCLKVVRLIVEHALFDGQYAMYGKWLSAGTTRRPGDAAARLAAAQDDQWAADFESSCKLNGFAVSLADRQAGDLIFNHNGAVPFGHVGILLTPDWVLENISAAHRPDSIPLTPRNLMLTPITNRPWTLVARLPEP